MMTSLQVSGITQVGDCNFRKYPEIQSSLVIRSIHSPYKKVLYTEVRTVMGRVVGPKKVRGGGDQCPLCLAIIVAYIAVLLYLSQYLCGEPILWEGGGGA